ncbi:MAG TPA: LLM class flavin-dependent oxidoreductase [Solirubrobacteraceae bacterium]|jgi:alkanesulfonate monooxygenase SsuD/methylene tetrahydromethanopterin reductase-like flavin-dependent oxidoreductase (luciferase family)|nr:LLM class flavin-dependent oxidoreductase [Solirubrobacteraceae bacterium]
MRVGLYFDLRDPPPWRVGWHRVHARALETAAEADRRGVGSIWLSEHHFFEDGYLPQPLVFAAAVAARTRHARIGTAVVLAALRSALALAEEAAVVDVVSGGRLELGLGAGYRIPEYEAFGVDVAARFTLLEERGREVSELLASERVTPAPIQSPLPMWIGGHGPRAARIAGRLGAGLLSLSPSLLDPYRAALEQAGHPADLARMAGPLSYVLCEDPERTWATVREYAEYQWRTYDSYAQEGRDGAVRAPDLPAVFASGQAGTHPPVRAVTVEQAAAELRAAAAAMPVQHVFIWERVAGMPDAIADRHVELLVDHLIPELSEVPAAGPSAERVAAQQLRSL